MLFFQDTLSLSDHKASEIEQLVNGLENNLDVPVTYAWRNRGRSQKVCLRIARIPNKI
jgi:RNAse (barnase) inhibitor barstar